MKKSFIAVIGMINEATTEELPLRDIAVTGKDQYEAHKAALLKCNLRAHETVFKITEAESKIVLFDYKTGFVKTVQLLSVSVPL